VVDLEVDVVGVVMDKVVVVAGAFELSFYPLFGLQFITHKPHLRSLMNTL
jgi:hypothetical protein